jgi:hypothetical protein
MTRRKHATANRGGGGGGASFSSRARVASAAAAAAAAAAAKDDAEHDPPPLPCEVDFMTVKGTATNHDLPDRSRWRKTSRTSLSSALPTGVLEAVEGSPEAPALERHGHQDRVRLEHDAGRASATGAAQAHQEAPSWSTSRRCIPTVRSGLVRAHAPSPPTRAPCVCVTLDQRLTRHVHDSFLQT